MTPAEEARHLAGEAIAALGTVRRLWPQLAAARMPGTPGIDALVLRDVSERQAAVEDDQVRRDRRAAAEALRGGTTPSGQHAAPLRLGPLGARTLVVRTVRDLAGRLFADRLARGVPAAVTDPAMRRDATACPWCAGTGRAQRPAGWVGPWPKRPPSCGLCGGHGGWCTLCTGRACHCDLSDAVMAACLTIVGDALPTLVTVEPAAAAATALGRAEAATLAALGEREVDLRVIAAPCPACGRRDLRANVSSPIRHEWSVVCRSPLCVCTGPGCGCGRPVRYDGRRHRWPADEFADLADRLGVPLDDLRIIG